MTVLAVSTAGAILAWIGLALGVVILGVVVALLNRVVRPATEIRQYSKHILDAGIGIAKNLDDADQLLRTRGLASAVPPLATAYLERLGGPRP